MDTKSINLSSNKLSVHCSSPWKNVIHKYRFKCLEGKLKTPSKLFVFKIMI